MTTLSAASGYQVWAPHYEETAVSWLEELTVASLGLPPERGRLLDVGCGRARRLEGTSAELAVGVDLVPRMLQCATTDATLAAADVRALPFRDDLFDAVWCRLMIGHLAELERVYAELARVCRSGGTVLVTDFHPDAVAAGHRRTFTDQSSRTWEIEHHVHTPDAHVIAARTAGLSLMARRDGEVSPPIRSFYERAGRVDHYEAQLGLRLVLGLVYRVA
jgi:malonyl-CoA O-methyltransferase